jgi:hypothetical protein
VAGAGLAVDLDTVGEVLAVSLTGITVVAPTLAEAGGEPV